MAVLCIAFILTGACVAGSSLREQHKAADVERVAGAFIAGGLIGLGYALSRMW